MRISGVEVGKKKEWGGKLKWILPVAGVLLFLAGLIAGFTTAPRHDGPVQPQVKPVQAVKGLNGVLDETVHLYQDQLSTLQAQLGVLGQNTSDAIVRNDVSAIVQQQTDINKTLDPFFTTLFTLPLGADDNERATFRDELSKFMAPGKSVSVLYNLLSGSSPARQLSTPIRKTGSVIATYSAVSKDAGHIYQVVVPFATVNGVQSAVYMVELTVDHKINDIKYVGLILDGSAPYTKQLRDLVAADTGK